MVAIGMFSLMRRPRKYKLFTTAKVSNPEPNEEARSVKPDNYAATTEITTKNSPRSINDTVTKLTGLIEARKMRLFAVIDQTAEARRVGLELRPTTLVIFGNPVAGTEVMNAAPLSALDLPLKILVWADGEQAKVSYLAPGALAARYNLDADLASNLAGVDPLTDALVAD